MRELDEVGVATSASRTRSLVRGKIMAEDDDDLGLVLIQRGSFFNYCMSINRAIKAVNYRSEINKEKLPSNKSRPRLL